MRTPPDNVHKKGLKQHNFISFVLWTVSYLPHVKEAMTKGHFLSNIDMSLKTVFTVLHYIRCILLYFIRCILLHCTISAVFSDDSDAAEDNLWPDHTVPVEAGYDLSERPRGAQYQTGLRRQEETQNRTGEMIWQTHNRWWTDLIGRMGCDWCIYYIYRESGVWLMYILYLQGEWGVTDVYIIYLQGEWGVTGIWYIYIIFTGRMGCDWRGGETWRSTS